MVLKCVPGLSMTHKDIQSIHTVVLGPFTAAPRPTRQLHGWCYHPGPTRQFLNSQNCRVGSRSANDIP
ncbi:hypothetical protein DPMN_071850 [Dreissena polymorpha]|uniref:Uncharacterized protein n=1 Tax=Dreissena polymorpha TaxID=45954 RepID=A0A9D4BQ09_DREPO|nr:hypothetical protein DPMN_071850 [Dreissena polymorpha]